MTHFPSPVKAHLVGGSVRDALLGREAKDRDWVVVGATPELMVGLGFQPVGAHFPVFLHPESKEEYALARQERKTGEGHQAFEAFFAPSVTLEQDLSRRDLTINAMAQDDAGNITDPYGGQNDLREKILRHVSEAFAEDPLRVFRVARFLSRYGEFSCAPETKTLCQRLVDSGETDALSRERVFQEMSKGLMESAPARMIAFLNETGALARIHPELPSARAQTVFASLERAAGSSLPLEARWAVLLSEAPSAKTILVRLKAPVACIELAPLARQLVSPLQAPHAPLEIIELFERADAFRRPERFSLALDTCLALGVSFDPAPWREALEQSSSLDLTPVAAACAGNMKMIKQAVRAARAQTICAIGASSQDAKLRSAKP